MAAIGDQDEPAVEVHKQCYQDVYRYEYAYDDTKKHYERRDPSIDDYGSQAGQINGSCSGTLGSTKASLQWQQKISNFGGSNWKLLIQKGNRTLYCKAVEHRNALVATVGIDKYPECFGPFVTNQIDGNGKVMTDLRVTRVVGSARLGVEMNLLLGLAPRTK